MTSGQKIPALFAALLGQGVTTDQIEAAVKSVNEFPLGQDLTSLANLRHSRYTEKEVRSFMFKQTDQLGRVA